MDGIVTGKVEKTIDGIPTEADFHTVIISKFREHSVDWSKARMAMMFYGQSSKYVREYLFFPQDNYFIYFWGLNADNATATVTEMPEDENTTFNLSNGNYNDTFTWNRTTKVLTNTLLNGQYEFKYW